MNEFLNSYRNIWGHMKESIHEFPWQSLKEFFLIIAKGISRATYERNFKDTRRLLLRYIFWETFWKTSAEDPRKIPGSVSEIITEGIPGEIFKYWRNLWRNYCLNYSRKFCKNLFLYKKSWKKDKSSENPQINVCQCLWR